MEFDFDVASYIGAPPEHDGPYVGCISEELLRDRHRGPDLCEVLEKLGKNSAVAQGLRKPVTLGHPYLCGQRIYLLAERNRALGLLKVGPKRLFVAPPLQTQARGGRCQSDVHDALKEINPVCALDFYVHESCQRNGYGRLIFDAMLREERLVPSQLAYDRPSPKLIGFLAKHFGLTQYRPQNNNYVVFDDYFLAGGAVRATPPKREAEDAGRVRHVSSIFGHGAGPSPWQPGSLQQQPQLVQTLQQPPTYQTQLQQQPVFQMQQAPQHDIQSLPPWQPQSVGGARTQAPTPTVQAPWGTADGYGRAPPRLPSGSRRVSPSGSSAPFRQDMAAAGKPTRLPSRGGSRSASLPTASRRQLSSGPGSGDSCSTAMLGGAAGGSSSRFASPLSHAGHLLLG
eukprot:TRINITY_DN29948_c0_g1_i1.p1 TRINITY_DN29948_c0_g1~~TRINITY_DN29948_c0_g1_i1.p1  ORF type:complete len:398 (+),score=50.07 TRINITY_DN29948_c0_g1_i1:97-1290(+)